LLLLHAPPSFSGALLSSWTEIVSRCSHLLRFPTGARDILLPKASRPALGAT
jgi:hypothetical protein